MFDQRQPQFAFVHAAAGLAQFVKDGLEQGASCAEPAAAEQGDVEGAAELAGQNPAKERLAGSRRPDNQPHALRPLDAPRQRLPGGLDAGGGKVVLHARHGGERPLGETKIAFVHRPYFPLKSMIPRQPAITITPAPIQSGGASRPGPTASRPSGDFAG